MKLSGKSILLISPEPWGKLFVSKHHYAVTLANLGNKVYYLNPPSTKIKYSFEATEVKGLWTVNYPGFPMGLRFYPTFLQHFFIAKIYRELETLVGNSFDIIWSFDNSVFYDFSALPKEIFKISHIVDLSQDFQTAKAASTANICFCTSERIKSKLLQYNPSTYKINHGVVLQGTSPNGSVKLPGQQDLKALYVGNLSIPYLDWEKLFALAIEHVEVDFVFLGPKRYSNLSVNPRTNPGEEKTRKLPNVYFLPPVPAREIMNHLKVADILLLSYKNENYSNQLANPHKIMEYLASGKPIVATWTEEYVDKNLLYMAKDKESFIRQFRWVLENYDEACCYETKNARKAFALNNTYDKQIERIEGYICRNLNG